MPDTPKASEEVVIIGGAMLSEDIMMTDMVLQSADTMSDRQRRQTDECCPCTAPEDIPMPSETGMMEKSLVTGEASEANPEIGYLTDTLTSGVADVVD
ncbi:hypothetical protein SARC_07315 [Sphaeroforma arctica JP610]|uniref:Uncharacterized protein n=1 Tax=Sphaeroforma arctica JP610 TaxID=667725 RepID=A0A0L0FUI2_9EUKA|nr:hypothetical protein SARC_07315 [Sphaeroforma arctica JP610]KNC80324.1 hypothetical protein SARC_07315 [Sphaeroforma arctica JP610]|eukprot:XP_014154226.1 hypothetical protein SARC_07315 [Sphaeroforma arctica JP610]